MTNFLGRFVQRAKDCCSSPEKIKEFITGKKELLPYYEKFWIANYSKDALQKGLTGDMVKVIYIYDIDEFGDRIIDIKPYSKEKVFALREVHKMPGTDITEDAEKGLPIYSRTNLMEVSYI